MGVDVAAHRDDGGGLGDDGIQELHGNAVDGDAPV
jgi:hypothetical protein